MKKILRRFAVLFVIFVLGVAGTAFLQNSEITDNRSDMNNPSFPEVMVKVGNTYGNRMFGYKRPMQADFTRDSVTPLDTTKKLSFVINPYDTKVSSFSYEIQTSDGSKVLENRKVKNLGKLGDYLTADITIESGLRMNQEYSLQISLDTEVGIVYYYTRVVSRSSVNTEQYLKFVNSFAEKCMDKNAAEDLSSYLEPSDVSGTTNFSNISIHSGLSQISWDSLNPQIYKKGIPVIKDINETTASISLEYQISAKDSDGKTEIYDVTEFYRMRYTETRIMLLDFERSAQKVFSPSDSCVSDDGLLLGVRDKNVLYMVNSDASTAAFVQQGDLWSYSPDKGKMTCIFTFRKEKGDFRDSRNEHDIKIIRVDDSGDVDFVLYGYMNRGIREGECGVCVYHYNSDQNVVEEKVFIPCTESYEFLKKDLGTLSYVSGDNRLFLLFAGTLYEVDIENGSFQILDENIVSSSFAVSDTNAHAAWLVMEGEHAGQIKEIDFDTLESRYVTPENGEQLRVLGFMNEDLIWGRLKNEDIVTDTNGHVAEGIYTFCIESFEGEVKKEYHQEGMYITDVSIGGTLMEFDLSVKGPDGYAIQKKDNIMNNKKAAANQVSIELTSTSRTGTQVRMAFEEKPDTDVPLVLYAKMRSGEEREIALDTQASSEEVYYVYAYGGLEGIYQNSAEAVLRADACAGVVLNRSQQYVWERGNKKTKIQLNTEDIPKIILTGTGDKNQIQEGLGQSGMVLDLSGCTLDSVLYEVSAQRGVIAKTGEDTSVVIVGYDEYNTYLYDPATGETKPYGMNDSTALFEAAGNIFISYLENVNP